jgi:pimeloyl-ACP methyl ester carboxylesterase
MAERTQVAAADGRLLDVEVSGPAEGATVVYHPGTPDSGTMFGPLVQAGAERGLRHVTYSRPGYARSTRQERRRVADCAADVTAILDHLGVEEFFTVGVSGGGPHALACAALLGERVIAVATVGGVAPWGADGLDWLAGMGEENIAEFGAVQAGEEALRRFLSEQVSQFGGASGEDLIGAMGDLVSDVDRQALTGEYGDHLAHNIREALDDGIWGWFDDDMAFFAEWGFELGAIDVPVTIWQGEQDRFVPFAHGKWLAEHVPVARAELRHEHGHLSLAVGAYGEILDTLRAAR